jgi:hypothetical protein
MRWLRCARNDGKIGCHGEERVSRSPERSEGDETISKCHIAMENWHYQAPYRHSENENTLVVCQAILYPRT